MTLQSITLTHKDISKLTLAYDAASDGWFLCGYQDGSADPIFEHWHMSEEDAKAQASEEYGVSAVEWSGAEGTRPPTLDSNGTVLQDGDTVTLIKDLNVKGAGTTLKRGTTIKNISLTDNPEEIDCRTKEIKGLVLRVEFVKKI